MASEQGHLNVARDAASDIVRREWLSRSALWNIHGILMGLSVLLLMPLGALMIRRSSADAFRNHWILQAGGATCGGIGIIIGFFVSHHITLIHQFVGLVIFFALGGQAFMGVSHHMSFVRNAGPSKFSMPHIWLGRIILVGAGMNFVAGVYLRRWDSQRFLVFLAGFVFLIDAGGVVFLLWRFKNRREPWRQDYEDQQLTEFTLDDISEDEDEDDNNSNRRSNDRK